VIVFRHADARFPFLWERPDQPPGRWHGDREGPAHYFADTPDGAWAEFLRHEGIVHEAELLNVRRALWALEVPGGLDTPEPELPMATLTGGLDSYASCQAEARRLRAAGATALSAPSAALRRGGARGWKVDGGLKPAADRDGRVLVLFGDRPDLVGWATTIAGHPRADLLRQVRPL
jgi:hypothetical protein